jgi:AraC family transcriptional regulator of arabinose operon
MKIFNQEWQFNVGEVVYKKESTLGPRLQQDLQLVYLFSGDLRVSINEQTVQMKPGEVMLLLPGSIERFAFATRGETHHGWCSAKHADFDPQGLRSRFPQLERMVFTDTMQVTAQRALVLKHASSSTQSAYRDALIQTLFCEYLSRSTVLSPDSPRGVHPAVERAYAYMTSHTAEPMTLSELASNAGLTAAHLTRLFRQASQMTPMRYLWRLRLRRAAEFLQETGLTVAEVSARCGFSNPQHFAKRFKATYRMTPGQYRVKGWDESREG